MAACAYIHVKRFVHPSHTSPNQDDGDYNRFTEAALKKYKDTRVQEDQRQSSQQLAYAQQLRLSAVLFQKARNNAATVKALLHDLKQNLDERQVNELEKLL